MDLGKVGKVVLPGDVVGRINESSGNVKLGPGLLQDNLYIVVTKSGVLRARGNNKFWIASVQKRYIPLQEDVVIGIVLEKQSETYKVDIAGAHPAALPILGFEGASRKNRPNLNPGDIVYARVTVSNKDMDPELLCTNPSGKAEGYGPLSGGTLIHCNLSLCRDLLSKKCLVLQLLGKRIAYEIAVGLNGRVWINSSNPEHTILIANAIKTSEAMSDDNIRNMVVKILERI